MSTMVQRKRYGTTRDRGLWDRMVNSQFGSDHPVLSGPESVLAARKLYRFAMGRAFEGEVKLTSGRRYTWVRRGVMSVNPDKRESGARGLRAMIHDLSHYCHARLHPSDAPHSERQAILEAKMAEFALTRGFLEGSLKRATPPEKPKPDKVKVRHARLVARREKWATELERAKRLLAKAQREVREYERRHGSRLAA